TRLQVGAGEDALIGGFIILGDAPKRVMIRAIGPSLEGVNGTLGNPNLELHDSTGALIASNDDWQNAPNKRDIMNSGFAPTDSAEAAILTTLATNSSGSGYTAVLHSADGTSGVGLVEVYDLDSGPGASVLNISTRGNVQVGDNVMIGGFIISGVGTQRVLVRAIGPSLAGGVSDPLADPTLTLFDSQGTQIDFNDDWQDSPVAGEIEDTTIPPTDPSESAVLQTLVPGAYTAILAGFDNTTGTGLLEVYALIN
ncbi:MAG: DVUA0089 family protein, partial [Chthoniobacterales bacterium]